MIQPTGNKVVVLVNSEGDETTKTGIVVIRNRRQENSMLPATVLSIGPGELSKTGARMPMQVQVGDKVLITRFAGTLVEPDKVEQEDRAEVRILIEDDIHCIISEEQC